VVGESEKKCRTASAASKGQATRQSNCWNPAKRGYTQGQVYELKKKRTREGGSVCLEREQRGACHVSIQAGRRVARKNDPPNHVRHAILISWRKNESDLTGNWGGSSRNQREHGLLSSGGKEIRHYYAEISDQKDFLNGRPRKKRVRTQAQLFFLAAGGRRRWSRTPLLSASRRKEKQKLVSPMPKKKKARRWSHRQNWVGENDGATMTSSLSGPLLQRRKETGHVTRR